jgi:hypothetical protein
VSCARSAADSLTSFRIRETTLRMTSVSKARAIAFRSENARKKFFATEKFVPILRALSASVA